MRAVLFVLGHFGLCDAISGVYSYPMRSYKRGAMPVDNHTVLSARDKNDLRTAPWQTAPSLLRLCLAQRVNAKGILPHQHALVIVAHVNELGHRFPWQPLCKLG